MKRLDTSGRKTKPTEQLLFEGRLTGSVDGRPITITADETGVVLVVDSVGTAWRLRRQFPALAGVLAMLDHGQVPVRLRVGSLGEFPVLPMLRRLPGWLSGWLMR